MTIHEAFQSSSTVEEIRRVGYAVMHVIIRNQRYALSFVQDIPAMIPAHSSLETALTYRAMIAVWRHHLPEDLKQHLNEQPIQ